MLFATAFYFLLLAEQRWEVLTQNRDFDPFRWAACLIPAAAGFFSKEKKTFPIQTIALVLLNLGLAVFSMLVPHGQLQIARLCDWFAAAGTIFLLPVLYGIFYLQERCSGQPRQKRTGWIWISIFAVLMFALLAYMKFEASGLEVKERTLHPDNWPVELHGLRIAAITDLHLRNTKHDLQRLQNIVELTNHAEPDLIFLLGDYAGYGFHSQKDLSAKTIAAAFAGLKAKYGVFAVLGNHDYGEMEKPYVNAFRQNGIPLLEGKSATLKIRGKTLVLVGFSGKINTRNKTKPVRFSIPDGDARLVLSHIPDFSVEWKEPFSVMFSGHTHGGQINFPIIGPPAVPSRFGKFFRKGVFRRPDGALLHVGSGIGFGIFPLRFGNPPSIDILTLK